MFRKLLNKIKGLFFSGILFALPIVLTIYIIYVVINIFDNLITRTLFKDSILSSIPGLGFVLSILLMVIIGIITSNFLGRYLANLWDKLFLNIPIIKGIYSTIKQIASTILSKDSNAFKEVVLIEYPKESLWTIAFVTAENESEISHKLGGISILHVFVPTTPNPTSGFLIFVEKRKSIKLNMTTDEAMKLIISGGVLQPKKKYSTKDNNSLLVKNESYETNE